MAKFKSGDVVEHNGQWQIVCKVLSYIGVIFITGGNNTKHMYSVMFYEIKPVIYKR